MSKVFSTKFVILCIVGLFGLCLLPQNIQAKDESKKTYNLKFASWIPEQNSMHSAIKPWMKEVEEQTGGRIKVTPYYAEALGKSGEQLENLKTGVCDIAIPSINIFSSSFPVASGIIELPTLSPNQSITAEILHALIDNNLVTKEFAPYKLLWSQPASPFYLHFNNKKVTSLEDIKGMKLKSAGTICNLAVEALGAVPVGIVGPDLYMSLSTGVVEGGVTSISYFHTVKLSEVTKYYLWDMPITSGGTIIIMSKKRWDSLSPDIQLIIEQLSSKAERQYLDKELKANFRKAIVDTGVELYNLSAEEKERWKKAMAPIYDKWVAEMKKQGLPGQAALDIARQVIARFTEGS